MTVVRFWSPREHAYSLDQNGFLDDFGVLSTEELASHRCLVLLGEPGAGKSTSLRLVSELTPLNLRSLSFDLASYGSEDRLVRDVFGDPHLLAWADGTDELCLYLDSLDEARVRIPHLGSIIADCLRKLPLSRLHLRIACRTADWPTGLEETLKELFGSISVFEILPLRMADAAEIASICCEPISFLREVIHAGAGPLAARPLTLLLLARSFGGTGRLPSRGPDLYAEGVRALCDEQNPLRVDAGLRGDLSLDHRIAIARRIAAATVFGGRSVLWTGPEAGAPTEVVSVEQLVGGVELLPEGNLTVTTRDVREVARMGLFTSRGPNRLGWAHSTFADFLAGDWLVKNAIAEDQARQILLTEDNKMWPQTRLAAVWAVAISPETFGFLVSLDPASFQGEVELPGDALRAAVVDGLFSVAGTLTAAPWERSYSALRHAGVVEQIRTHLWDADPARRRLAFDLAGDCAAAELADDLANIVTDETVRLEDRVAAGWAMARLPESHSCVALTSLAVDPVAPHQDPRDELKGVALLVSWPTHISTSAVFEALKMPRVRSHSGSYAIFLRRFRDGLTDSDVDAGMQWLLADLNAPASDPRLGAIANRVIALAVKQPRDMTMLECLYRIVVSRLREGDAVLYEDLHGSEEDPLQDPELRKSITTLMLERSCDATILYGAVGGSSPDHALVRASDLPWLVESYAPSSPDVRKSVLSLILWVLDIATPEHRDLILGLNPQHPLYLDFFHAWVDPVEIGSLVAEQMRRSWSSSRKPDPQPKDDEVNARIEAWLARFESGEAIGFWQASRLLTVNPGATHYGAEYDPDVVGMRRWETLGERVRERIVQAAYHYLQVHPCEPGEWLSRPDIRYHPAEAGYRAMLILLRICPERLESLPPKRWVEWAPVLASWSTGFINGADWADKLKLLDMAGPGAHEAVRAALLTRLDALVTAGERPQLRNEARYLWNRRVANRYVAFLDTVEAEALEEIVETLAESDLDVVRETLLEWVRVGADHGNFGLAVRMLVDLDFERSWGLLEKALSSNIPAAEAALSATLAVRGYERLENVSPATVADALVWLLSNFPRELDPEFDDAHFVGPREQIGNFRDRLLSRLQEQGSPEAVEALRRIAAERPHDRSVLWALTVAEAGLRRDQWRPLPVHQLLRLGSRPDSVLVSNADGLTSAVLKAFGDIQRHLTGATPGSHLLWDSHSGRPKSEDEISDFLAHRLTEILVYRGLVINREVQVRRSRPSGIGERVDILVEALPADSQDTARLALPIEVKGAWNGELMSAMRNQLTARYMKDLATVGGLYLVLWPDTFHWTDSGDDRRRAFRAINREEVELKLSAQADALREQGLRVRVLHLDICYGRPVDEGSPSR